MTTPPQRWKRGGACEGLRPPSAPPQIERGGALPGEQAACQHRASERGEGPRLLQAVCTLFPVGNKFPAAWGDPREAVLRIIRTPALLSIACGQRRSATVTGLESAQVAGAHSGRDPPSYRRGLCRHLGDRLR